MNTNLNKSRGETAAFGRRSFLILLATGLGVFGWFKIKPSPMAKVAPFVKPKKVWTPNHFYNFLTVLPTNVMLALKQSLGILKQDATESQLKGSDQDARDVQKEALWLSSNILAYPFLDEKELDYHKLVTWVSSEAGVAPNMIQNSPTFALERELHKLLFAQMWDKLSTKQRRELLSKLDTNGAVKDKAAIATLSGAGALAVLSSAVAFTGFTFYTTMSMTIAAAAGTVGVTLPFATYVGASSIVGVLSGPVGWAIMGVAALGGIALAGRPNLQKSTALIGQIHALKVEALVAAGVSEQDVFY